MGSKKRSHNEISRTRKRFDLATGQYLGGEGGGNKGAGYRDNLDSMAEILQLDRRNREESAREAAALLQGQ